MWAPLSYAQGAAVSQNSTSQIVWASSLPQNQTSLPAAPCLTSEAGRMSKNRQSPGQTKDPAAQPRQRRWDRPNCKGLRPPDSPAQVEQAASRMGNGRYLARPSSGQIAQQPLSWPAQPWPQPWPQPNPSRTFELMQAAISSPAQPGLLAPRPSQSCLQLSAAQTV